MALYAGLSSLSERGALPDIEDHEVELPSLEKEDLAVSSVAGGVCVLIQVNCFEKTMTAERVGADFAKYLDLLIPLEVHSNSNSGH